MDTPTFIMMALAVVLFLIACLKGENSHILGLKAGMELLIKVMPRVFFAFIVAGMIQVLLPKAFILKWVGSDSGMKGILVGTIAGALTPGGPFTHFPIIASFYKAGADIAPMIAYLTAWSVLGVHRIIIWEIPLLGNRVTFIRVLVSMFFPVIAGLLTKLISSTD